MVPIVLDTEKLSIAVVGTGPEALGRLRLLRRHGAHPVAIYLTAPDEAIDTEADVPPVERLPTAQDLRTVDVVFAGGLTPVEADALQVAARQAKVLLNVEDMRTHCDFHMPATVLRGDLLMTVSTGGASPGLARRIARRLGELFGAEWEGRLGELRLQREKWRAAGRDAAAVKQETDHYIDQKGWLS